MEVIKPSLTEFTTKYYLRHSLNQARIFKDKYITLFVNIFLLLIFILLFGTLLLYKYKGKLSPEEKKYKEREKKMYIFQKLQQYAYDKQKQNQTMITDLPVM